MNYPIPEQNPYCQCMQSRGNAAAICPFGHLLECHFPYQCNEAACNHLNRYDYEPEQVQQIETWVRDLMQKGLRSPYSLDAKGRIVIKD